MSGFFGPNVPIVASGFFGKHATGGSWSLRAPPLGVNGINWVGGSSTRLVVFGDRGILLYSDDHGATWHTGSGFSSTNTGRAMAVHGTLWVAVCDNGVTLTSADGATWSISGTIAPLFGTPTMVYGNGLYVVGSQNSAQNNDVWTSPDGVTWTPQGTGTPNQLQIMLYDGTNFVGWGLDSSSTNTVVATSPDGTTWGETVTNELNDNVTGMAFDSGSNYVASIGPPTVFKSPSATAWVSTTVTQPLNNSTVGVAFNAGTWVIAGSKTGVAFSQAATGTDLATWTLEDLKFGTSDQVLNMRFVGGVFVAWSTHNKLSTRN